MTSEDIIAFTVQNVKPLGHYESVDSTVLPSILAYEYARLTHQMKKHYTDLGYEVVGDPMLTLRIEGYIRPPLDKDLLDMVDFAKETDDDT